MSTESSSPQVPHATSLAGAKKYEIHDWSLRLPPQTPDERLALKRNMIERVLKGLNPLEFPILLMDGKIVDGRHRYEIWLELAAEGACDGYFAKNIPLVEEAKAEEGENRAATRLRLHSRNLCHRSLSADQRAAQLLLDIEDSPELKALVEQIEAENETRMKAGKARETNNQGSTNKQLGKKIGVSDGTMKKAKAVKKHASDKLKDVAQGKKTANEVLNEVKATKKKEAATKPKTEPAGPIPLLDAKEGDSVLTILPYIMGSGDVKIQERIVRGVQSDDYLFEDRSTLPKNVAFTGKEAQKARKQELQRAFRLLEDEAAKVKAALKQDGEILAPYKQRGRPPKNTKVSESQTGPDATLTDTGKELIASPLPTGTVSLRKLRGLFGPYAEQVLEEYLEELESEKGGMRSYTVVQALPTPDEYTTLQDKKFSRSVTDLVESAFADFEDLASEVGDWYDNLPEGLQSSDKGYALEEARSALENLSQTDVPASIADATLVYLPLRDVSSRSDRRNNAVGQLQAVVDQYGDSADDDIRHFADELEGVISEVEEVEFPSMY